jgi:hypothetical protein
MGTIDHLGRPPTPYSRSIGTWLTLAALAAIPCVVLTLHYHHTAHFQALVNVYVEM